MTTINPALDTEARALFIRKIVAHALAEFGPALAITPLDQIADRITRYLVSNEIYAHHTDPATGWETPNPYRTKLEDQARDRASEAAENAVYDMDSTDQRDVATAAANATMRSILSLLSFTYYVYPVIAVEDDA